MTLYVVEVGFAALPLVELAAEPLRVDVEPPDDPLAVGVALPSGSEELYVLSPNRARHVNPGLAPK